MKLLKLMSVCVLTLIFSCSTEEETYDFSGVYNLASVSVSNFEFNNFGQYNFRGIVQADENCLTDSSLLVFPNNTALLKLRSKVVTTIQVVEGTTNELEQILTCESIEEDIYLTWASGGYSVELEDGNVVTALSTDDFELIRFLDENGEIVFSGFRSFGDSIVLSPSDTEENSILMELEGEELLFSNTVSMLFSR